MPEGLSGIGTIRCTRCGVRRPSSDFRWMSTVSRHYSQCRECERITRAESRARVAARGPRRARANIDATTGLNRSGRVFGVEIELTGPDAQTIFTALRTAGISLRSTRVTGYHQTNENDDAWELKRDGSVHGHGLELVSPKLSGDWGFAQLETVCTALNSVHATVDRSCGLHVHHDFRRLDLDAIKRQISPVLKRQHLWMNAVAPSRRSGNGYCSQWTIAQLERFEQSTDLSSAMRNGPRGTVNLGAYGLHGSVEVRAHGGTTSAAKIGAWVRFMQTMFAMGACGAFGDSYSYDTTTSLETLTDAVARWARINGSQHPFTARDAETLMRFENASRRAAEQVEAAEYAAF